MKIPDEAVEAAIHAYMQYPRTRGIDNSANMFRAALEAAAPHIMASAWDEAYRQGVEDERPSAAWATDYGPNRNNPYRNAGAVE